MQYFICKKESVKLSHLSVVDKMQAILDHFQTNIEVLSSRLDERTFSPIFQIRLNGIIRDINVNRTLIEDMVSALENYDNNHVIFLNKKAIYEGRLEISSKKVK